MRPLGINICFPPHSRAKGFKCRLFSCKSDKSFTKLADREKHVAQRHQNFFDRTSLENETALAIISSRNRNTAGQVNCLELRRYKCNICHATGDSTPPHTQRNCPLNRDGKYNGEGASHTELKKNVAGLGQVNFEESTKKLTWPLPSLEGEDTRMALARMVKTGPLTGILLDDPPPGDMKGSENDSEDIEVLWDRKEEVKAGNKRKEVSDEEVAKILKRKENKSAEEVSKKKANAAPPPVLLEQQESIKLTQLYQELQLYR